MLSTHEAGSQGSQTPGPRPLRKREADGLGCRARGKRRICGQLASALHGAASAHSQA